MLGRNVYGTYEEVKKILEESIKIEKAWPDIVDQVSKLTARVSCKLASRGWYVPWLDEVKRRELKDIRSLDKKDDPEIDQFFCDFYDRRLDDIRKEMTQRFPDRKNCLDEAFEAHLKGKYYLSIPVFLAQADGIFVDLTGLSKGVYQRIQSDPVTKTLINGLLLDDYTEVYLEHLNAPSTLILNKNERLKRPVVVGINRHMILHGESIDYGTKMNSLKAMSFLCFVKTTFENLSNLTTAP